MLALKGLALVVAVALVVGPQLARAQPPQHTAAAQLAHHGPRPHEPKAKRLPHLRVVQVGARIHAHVTVKI